MRDLRQNASRVLARVKAGETIEVTERGTPIARLVPIDASSSYQRLLEAGDLLPGEQAISDIQPVRVGSGARLSEELAALRADDWR